MMKVPAGKFAMIAIVFLISACSGGMAEKKHPTSNPNVGTMSAPQNVPQNVDAHLPRFCLAPRVGFGDMADASTTAYGLSAGLAQEGNPLFSSVDPDAIPFIGIAVKFGIKKFLIHKGVAPETANRKVERMGWFASVANIATLSGVAMPVGLGMGVIAAIISDDGLKKKEVKCKELRAQLAAQTAQNL